MFLLTPFLPSPFSSVTSPPSPNFCFCPLLCPLFHPFFYRPSTNSAVSLAIPSPFLFFSLSLLSSYHIHNPLFTIIFRFSRSFFPHFPAAINVLVSLSKSATSPYFTLFSPPHHCSYPPSTLPFLLSSLLPPFIVVCLSYSPSLSKCFNLIFFFLLSPSQIVIPSSCSSLCSFSLHPILILVRCPLIRTFLSPPYFPLFCFRFPHLLLPQTSSFSHSHILKI